MFLLRKKARKIWELKWGEEKEIQQFKHNAKYKHITIRFEPYRGDLVIRANKHEIKQVILNLLKNSFEAMALGGEIYIATKVRRSKSSLKAPTELKTGVSAIFQGENTCKT